MCNLFRRLLFVSRHLASSLSSTIYRIPVVDDVCRAVIGWMGGCGAWLGGEGPVCPFLPSPSPLTALFLREGGRFPGRQLIQLSLFPIRSLSFPLFELREREWITTSLLPVLRETRSPPSLPSTMQSPSLRDTSSINNRSAGPCREWVEWVWTLLLPTTTHSRLRPRCGPRNSPNFPVPSNRLICSRTLFTLEICCTTIRRYHNARWVSTHVFVYVQILS